MIRTTTRSRVAAEAIRDRKDFRTSGQFHGQRVPDGGLGPGVAYNSWLTRGGSDYDQWVADCYDVDYVVWSFATPIAWHTRTTGWHVVSQRFSPTTGKHQSNLYLIPTEARAKTGLHVK